MMKKSMRKSSLDGRMKSLTTHPDEQRAYPAVLMYGDASGMRGELRDMATRGGLHGACRAR